MTKTMTARKVGWLLAGALLAVLLGAWGAAALRDDFVGRAVRSGLFVRCGLVALASLAALVGMAAFLLRRRRSDGKSAAARVRGTAMVEFVLVFPVALTVMLILIQAMLMMTATLHVNYAAYAAARTAIVWVPRDLGADDPYVAEPANTVVDEARSRKKAAIKSAAVLACLPAAGQGAGNDPTGGQLQAGLQAYFQAQGRPVPTWVNTYVPGKIAYASSHTSITLADGKTSPNAYEPSEDLTVTVRHDYNLTIPFANRLFGQRYDASTDKWTTTVTASCTLNNEGVNDVIEEDSFAPPGGPVAP